jgi:hypothetical protein
MMQRNPHNGTIPTGNYTIGTVPVGFRPKYVGNTIAISDDGGSYVSDFNIVEINSAGNLVIQVFGTRTARFRFTLVYDIA